MGPGRQEGARNKSQRRQDVIRALVAPWVPQGPPRGSGRELRGLGCQPEVSEFPQVTESQGKKTGEAT